LSARAPKNGFAQKVEMLLTLEKTYQQMNNAESVREFQPRVCALATLGKRISFFEGATLKELHRRLLTAKPRNPFRVVNNLLGHFFKPRVSKQTLG